MNHVIGRSVKESNKIWRWSKLNHKPFLAVKKKIKYASIDYDMYTINYDLTEDAIAKLRVIRDRLLDENFKTTAKKSVWSSISKSSGYISDILIEIAIQFLPEFKEILFDESNWIGLSPMLRSSNKEETEKC